MTTLPRQTSRAQQLQQPRCQDSALSRPFSPLHQPAPRPPGPPAGRSPIPGPTAPDPEVLSTEEPANPAFRSEPSLCLPFTLSAKLRETQGQAKSVERPHLSARRFLRSSTPTPPSPFPEDGGCSRRSCRAESHPSAALKRSVAAGFDAISLSRPDRCAPFSQQGRC